MANFKRNKPRLRTYRSEHNKRSIQTYWLNTWPAWWDRTFHMRPFRREEKKLLGAVFRGVVDPEDTCWPRGRKPHRYFW